MANLRDGLESGAHLLFPRNASSGTLMQHPANGMVTAAAVASWLLDLSLLLDFSPTGAGVRRSCPFIASACHLVATALFPSVTGGQDTSACKPNSRCA